MVEVGTRLEVVLDLVVRRVDVVRRVEVLVVLVLVVVVLVLVVLEVDLGAGAAITPVKGDWFKLIKAQANRAMNNHPMTEDRREEEREEEAIVLT